jgi:hypothetical protein
MKAVLGREVGSVEAGWGCVDMFNVVGFFWISSSLDGKGPW